MKRRLLAAVKYPYAGRVFTLLSLIACLRERCITYRRPRVLLPPNVSIEGTAGARARTIIQGDAMSATAHVGNVIRVAASHFELSGVTRRRSRYHLIQIAGEDHADAPVIRGCVLRDAYEQMIKVSAGQKRPDATSNGGLIENCIFEYTAGIGPQYYIGGIDAHGAKHWIIRGNLFRDIASPGGRISEFAVHFWDGSADNIIERNRIINCDQGVGFGSVNRRTAAGSSAIT